MAIAAPVKETRWTGPDIYNQAISSQTWGASGLAPTLGSIDLHLLSGTPAEATSEQLCATLKAGVAYSMGTQVEAPTARALGRDGRASGAG